ncbi:uncharacterized protein UV8b_03005 [Ustilaginoidea virens]|uniref:SGNH hydrolase-type esterase domain-containing protein n=1 Tax=Ustilaginoidea virens TaxID=1159556 RepID=A0A8E5HPL1_USTVR|nr:uncharacterized protein UV8b_03005 [Ustilaginoidea virens]QUC18764.1 hypothetical protein UV8b_03005 [Ustilaginoidea virens]
MTTTTTSMTKTSMTTTSMTTTSMTTTSMTTTFHDSTTPARPPPSTSTAMATRSLDILCFGDSLTSGFYAYGLGSHPYSIRLQARLQAALPETTVRVHTNGRPGDYAAFDGFRTRLEAECSKQHFDWVIILGGTNDLALHVEPPQMYAAFRRSWAIPLSQGSRVLALTVPETECRAARLVSERAHLNRLILAHREPNFHSFDLHSSLPFHSLSDDEKSRYWDDGVHLTDKGYDWMGGLVADALLEAFSSADSAEATCPRSQGPNSPGTARHEALLEEEGGDPRKLSEGYVVVRKKDLW